MGSTDGHYSKRYLVVSETEPVDPADGLLWFDPTPCPPTTTTTGEPEATTTTTAEPFFMMKFDDLDNASLMIGGDASDVADWNTFFDLPTNGTPFDNIALDGVLNTVTLYGGGNMTLSAYLFGDNDPSGTSLFEVEDNGVTVACEDGVFSDYNIGLGCYGVTKVILPSLNIDGTKEVFADCEVLAELDIDFDSIITLGDDSFDTVPVLPQYDFPNLVTAGEYCFLMYPGLVNPNFSSLTTTGYACFLQTSLNDLADFSSLSNIGRACFEDCIGLINPAFPVLTIISREGFKECSGLVSPVFLSNITSVGAYAFYLCTGLTSIDLSSCTDLGGTTGNDSVFEGITGKTITITIPHALESDGDIVWLVANNTVTIIYSD